MDWTGCEKYYKAFDASEFVDVDDKLSGWVECLDLLDKLSGSVYSVFSHIEDGFKIPDTSHPTIMNPTYVATFSFSPNKAGLCRPRGSFHLVGSLKDLDLSSRYSIAACICAGLSVLHDDELVNGCVSSSSIMLSRDSIKTEKRSIFAQLSLTGLVPFLLNQKSEMNVQFWRKRAESFLIGPPEFYTSEGKLVDNVPFSASADMFAFGVLCAELLAGKYTHALYASPEEMAEETLEWRNNNSLDNVPLDPCLGDQESDSKVKHLRTIIKRCTALKAENRPSSKEVLGEFPEDLKSFGPLDADETVLMRRLRLKACRSSELIEFLPKLTEKKHWVPEVVDAINAYLENPRCARDTFDGRKLCSTLLSLMKDFRDDGKNLALIAVLLFNTFHFFAAPEREQLREETVPHTSDRGMSSNSNGSTAVTEQGQKINKKKMAAETMGDNGGEVDELIALTVDFLRDNIDHPSLLYTMLSFFGKSLVGEVYDKVYHPMREELVRAVSQGILSWKDRKEGEQCREAFTSYVRSLRELCRTSQLSEVFLKSKVIHSALEVAKSDMTGFPPLLYVALMHILNPLSEEELTVKVVELGAIKFVCECTESSSALVVQNAFRVLRVFIELGVVEKSSVNGIVKKVNKAMKRFAHEPLVLAEAIDCADGFLINEMHDFKGTVLFRDLPSWTHSFYHCVNFTIAVNTLIGVISTTFQPPIIHDRQVLENVVKGLQFVQVDIESAHAAISMFSVTRPLNVELFREPHMAQGMAEFLVGRLHWFVGNKEDRWHQEEFGATVYNRICEFCVWDPSMSDRLLDAGLRYILDDLFNLVLSPGQERFNWPLALALTVIFAGKDISDLDEAHRQVLCSSIAQTLLEEGNWMDLVVVEPYFPAMCKLEPEMVSVLYDTLLEKCKNPNVLNPPHRAMMTLFRLAEAMEDPDWDELISTVLKVLEERVTVVTVQQAGFFILTEYAWRTSSEQAKKLLAKEPLKLALDALQFHHACPGFVCVVLKFFSVMTRGDAVGHQRVDVYSLYKVALRLMDEHSGDENIQGGCCEVLYYSVSAARAGQLANAQIDRRLFKILDQYAENKVIQDYALNALFNFAHFGKLDKRLAKNGFYSKLGQALESFIDDPLFVADMVSSIAYLTEDVKSEQQLNLLEVVMQAMDRHPTNAMLANVSCAFIGNIAGFTKGPKLVQCIQRVLHVMGFFLEFNLLQANCLNALTFLLVQAGSDELFFANDGTSIVRKVMEAHEEDSGVQQAAWMLVHQIVLHAGEQSNTCRLLLNDGFRELAQKTVTNSDATVHARIAARLVEEGLSLASVDDHL